MSQTQSPEGEAVAAALAKYGRGGTVQTWVGARDRVTPAVAGALPGDATWVDVADRPQSWWTDAAARLGRRFRPVRRPQPCDLLVWDGEDTADAAVPVLRTAAAVAAKAVVLVGAAQYAEQSVDIPKRPGLLPAVRQFLRAHPGWIVSRMDLDGAGAVTVSRDPSDLGDVTHGVRDAFRFLKAELTRKFDGGKYLSLPMARERVDTCLTCTLRGGSQGGNCKVCRCYLFQIPDEIPVKGGKPGKVFYPHERCPIGKWDAVPDGGETYTPDGLEELVRDALGITSDTP